MEENTLIEKLTLFGLTRQEATIYMCLAANHELSGYEVSKLTGISRSNVYAALANLVEEGAAYLLEGSTNKYTCVAIDEFCETKINRLQKVKDELVKGMPQSPDECEGYITISNYRHIMDRMHFMMIHAQYRIYLSMPVSLIEACRADIERLIQNDKKVVLLVSQPVDFEGCIQYITEDHGSQMRLIVDSTYVLTGEVTGNASDTCLYCGQPNFVNVFKESLKNEIKLIELTRGETE